MIKQIVVHPKGATHIQHMGQINYFLKCVEGVWQFFTIHKRWIDDELLNNTQHPTHNFTKILLKPIGELHV